MEALPLLSLTTSRGRIIRNHGHHGIPITILIHITVADIYVIPRSRVVIIFVFLLKPSIIEEINTK